MAYSSSWETHLKPRLGSLELQHVNKGATTSVLDKMAAAGESLSTIENALAVMNDLFREAQEQEYIVRNPMWRVTAPRAKERTPTRAMTEEEVRCLFDSTKGLERLWWRILILTGAGWRTSGTHQDRPAPRGRAAHR